MKKNDVYTNNYGIDIPKHAYPGKLIVIEGNDGSGKTTQLQLLKAYLEQQNTTVRTLDFPRYYDSLYGKFIAQYLRGEFGQLKDVNPYLISFPYALDRASAGEEMRAWLSYGDTVLLNRYTTSNLAHQSARFTSAKKAQEYIKWDLELEYMENNLPLEDVVIFLHVPYKTSLRLMENRERENRAYTNGKRKDMVESNVEYLKRSEKAYTTLASRFSHWVTISCVEKNGELKSREAIHEEIKKVLVQQDMIRKGPARKS